MSSSPVIPDPLAGLRCQLGEGPSWDAAGEVLTWVDILAGELHSWSHGAAAPERIAIGGELGAALPRSARGFVLAVDRQLRVREPDGAERVLAEVEPEYADNRFNDCRVDPQGRLWAGTMSKPRRPGEGSLYRLEAGGEVERVLAGTTISNGIGWSGSGERMYFVDSTTQRIDVFDFDGADGSLHERRRFAAVDPAAGLPDGLTVDAEDGIWVALFGGSAVHRYDPDGELDAVIELPVTNTTCPAFGGTDLETLFVTTTRHRLSAEQLAAQPLAGALFACRPGVRGRPGVRCEI